MKKECLRLNAYFVPFSYITDTLGSMAVGDLHRYKEYLFIYYNFHCMYLEFAKTELYLIGGYQNE